MGKIFHVDEGMLDEVHDETTVRKLTTCADLVANGLAASRRFGKRVYNRSFVPRACIIHETFSRPRNPDRAEQDVQHPFFYT